MIKAILMSFQPKWAGLILNGLKTLELRGVLPIELKEKIEQGSGMWLYIYETLGKTRYVNNDELWEVKYDNYYNQGLVVGKGRKITEGIGMIVGRFWIDEFDAYYYNEYQGDYRLLTSDGVIFRNATIPYDELCLTEEEVNKYGNEKDYLYTLKIKNLEIFSEPKELREFYVSNPKPHTIRQGFTTMFVEPVKESLRLKKAPQSFQYVYVKGKEND